MNNKLINKNVLITAGAQGIGDDNDILFSEPWCSVIKKNHVDIQSVVTKSINHQLHIPCLLEALNYFYGLKTANGSANLIQAQRDYFGAHTYQIKDDNSGKNYHTQWNN